MTKKRIITEALAIAIIASIIGLIYNAFSPKSLKLIPASAEEMAVPDSVLFKNIYSESADGKNTVTFQQVERMLQNPQFQFIDARRPDQFEQGHIGNSVNIYPEDPEDVRIPKIFSLPKDKIIVIYCDGGSCDLSHELYNELTTVFDFKKVFIYQGGWEEWSAKRK